jgi:hypothetical protein
MQMLVRGVFPVGSFCGGALASVIGVRPTLTLGALGFLSSSLWLVFSPIRKLREYPTRSRRDLRHQCRRGSTAAFNLHVQ